MKPLASGLAALALALGLAGCSAVDRAGEPSRSPTPPPAIVDYVDAQHPSGIVITGDSDAAGLRGAAADFRAFITAEVRQSQTEARGAGCQGASANVWRYAQAGYALGESQGCTGTAVVWARVDGTWRDVIAGGPADSFECSELARFRVPVALWVGHRCAEDFPHGDRTHPYTG